MFEMFDKKYKVKTVQDSIDQVLAKMEKEEAMQQNPSMYEPQPQPISMQQEVMMSMMNGGNPALSLMNQQQGFNGMVDFSNPASVGNMQNNLQNDPNFQANQNAVLAMMNQALAAMPNVQVSPAGPPPPPPQWNGYSQQPFPQMVGNNFALNPNLQQAQYQNPLDGIVPADPNAFNNSSASWYTSNPFPTQQGLSMNPNVGGWNTNPSYYNLYMNDPFNREAYMRFTEEEIRSGQGFVVKVVSKTQEEIDKEKQQEFLDEQEAIRNHPTWEEKLNPDFKVVIKTVDRELPEHLKKQQQQESQVVEEEVKEEGPSRVIIECLNSEIDILKGWLYEIKPKDLNGLDKEKIIVPKLRRLFFNKRDEEALRNLCRRLQVYNPPLARVVWAKRHLKYRDDYQLFITAAEDILNEYEIAEMFDKEDEGYYDYRVPMRNRKLPEYTIDENGKKIFDENYYEYHPFRKYTDDTFEYEYDRGRELTKEEFNLFCEYEETCLVYSFHQLRLKNFYEVNRRLQNLPLSYSVDRKELATREEKLRKLLEESISIRENAEAKKKEKIEQHESSSPVLPDEIRKLPDIADADRTTGTEENEAEAALERFSRHEANLLKNIMKGTAKTKAVPFIISYVTKL